MQHNSWKCTVQGWARVYFSLVEFGLITVITFTCYLMIVKHEFGIQDVSCPYGSSMNVFTIVEHFLVVKYTRARARTRCSPGVQSSVDSLA